MSIERITSNVVTMSPKSDKHIYDSDGVTNDDATNDDVSNQSTVHDSGCNIGDRCAAFWIRLGRDILNFVKYAIVGCFCLTYWTLYISLFWGIWV